QRARIAAELFDNRLIRRTGGAAARDEKAGGQRDDEGGNLRDDTIADRQLDENVRRLADLHAVTEITDDDAAENIDGGDDEACDRITTHEFGSTVHGAEERAFLLQFAAPALGFLVIDHACRQVRVDRHLLAGDGIEGEAGADFRDTRRTL